KAYIITQAESALVKANPPVPPQERGRGNKMVIEDNHFSKNTMKQMRRAHRDPAIAEEAIKRAEELNGKRLGKTETTHTSKRK
ncbi:MAG: hypothetical protein OXC66_04650, partial [Roseovarius sp.]|nr:hypothetical protein [Roseovarius sp.]